MAWRRNNMRFERILFCLKKEVCFTLSPLSSDSYVANKSSLVLPMCNAVGLVTGLRMAIVEKWPRTRRNWGSRRDAVLVKIIDRTRNDHTRHDAIGHWPPTWLFDRTFDWRGVWTIGHFLHSIGLWPMTDASRHHCWWPREFSAELSTKLLVFCIKWSH